MPAATQGDDSPTPSPVTLWRQSGLPDSRSSATSSPARVPESDLPALADEAAQQWTGRYNPRPFDAAAARELYRAAFA